MDIVINGKNLGGTVPAIPSKSYAHRALICAFLRGRNTHVVCPEINEDILATVRCLNALGGEILRTEDGFLVSRLELPGAEVSETCQKDYGDFFERVLTGTYDFETRGKNDDHFEAVLPDGMMNKEIVLDCGESGSTLRFLLPVTAALGVSAMFTGSGRLPSRPVRELCDCLRAGGVTVDSDYLPIRISGKLQAGSYMLPPDVSSQYFTGMLLALSVLKGESAVQTDRPPESLPYIQLTIDVMKQFGITVETEEGCCFRIPARESAAEVVGNAPVFPQQGSGREKKSSMVVCVEGDWSNAAPWLCMGAIGRKPVTVTGLNPLSAQGDRAVLDILRNMGATVVLSQENISGESKAETESGSSVHTKTAPDGTDFGQTEKAAERADFGRVKTAPDGTGSGQMIIAEKPGKALYSVTVSGDVLHAVDIDARDIPDLMPAISAVCAFCEGTSRIRGAGRLRLKESDRIAGIADALRAIDVQVTEYADGLEICGKGKTQLQADLRSKIIDAENDHRLVMAAACMSVGLDADITICGAEAVAKSYPSFFEKYESIGGLVIRQ